MFIFSLFLMFISSSLLFVLLSICQIGPGWEVPIGLVGKMSSTGYFGIIFFVLGLLFFWGSWKTFYQLDGIRKSIYILWVCFITCAVITIIIHGTPIDAFRINNKVISKVAYNSKLPGILLNIIILIYLFTGYIKQNW